MKETMDKVLSYLQKDRGPKTEKILYKPDMKRSIIGFLLSIVFFLMMIGFCIVKCTFGCFLLLGVSIGFLIFYGANVFTKEGFWIQKYVDSKIIDKLEEEKEINKE